MAITCSRSIISIFLVANVSENFERNSVNVADMVLISSFPSTTVAFCICNSEESLNIIFNFFSFPVRHRTKIGAGGCWLTGYILISVAALNRKLFKKGKLSKQIAINGKSFATVDMGTYTIPDGYDLLGIIPFSSGYGDQWQVSFSEYGKKYWRQYTITMDLV